MSRKQQRRLAGIAGEEMEAEQRVLCRRDNDGQGAGLGGMGDGAAAAVREEQAVAFAADDEESRLNMPTLGDELLFHILHQFMGDSYTTAAINKFCKQAVEEAAEEELRQISENHHVGNVFMWRLGLARLAPARIASYYEQQGMLPTPGIEPTITPRLRLCCAKEAPLSSHEMQNLGPAAVLSDGNLVFYCVEDRLFRFYNVQGGTFYHQARATGSSVPRVELDTWIGKDLHCCNGFLILQSSALFLLGPGGVSFSVWRQSDLTFVRDIRLTGGVKASVFDKERGTIIFTVSRDDTAFLDIMSVDIESGERSLVKSVHTQLSGTVMSDCVLSMGISGRNIVIAAFIEEDGQFPNSGLGVYTLSRDHPEEDPKYFPCFEQGIYLNFPSEDPCQWPFILFRFNNDQEPLRAICQLSGEDPPVVVDELVRLGERRHIVRVTDTRLFVMNEEDEDIQVDEIDIQTGRKVRTIRTGYSTDDHLLAYVESTETVLFLMISRVTSPVRVFQTFLL